MLKLTRNRYTEFGIFGKLSSDMQNMICYTLEHSYNGEPKLQDGQYTCVRGQHRLAHMDKAFTTFEITEVPGHTGILFHCGNYNADSNGCVLVGTSLKIGGLSESKIAFDKFMQTMDGIDQFQLTVTSE